MVDGGVQFQIGFSKERGEFYNILRFQEEVLFLSYKNYIFIRNLGWEEKVYIVCYRIYEMYE